MFNRYAKPRDSTASNFRRLRVASTLGAFRSLAKSSIASVNQQAKHCANRGVKLSEVKFSEACSVSENLTLPKISRYTVVVIGASLSEPHMDEYNGCIYSICIICIYVYIYIAILQYY